MDRHGQRLAPVRSDVDRLPDDQRRCWELTERLDMLGLYARQQGAAPSQLAGGAGSTSELLLNRSQDGLAHQGAEASGESLRYRAAGDDESEFEDVGHARGFSFVA